MKRGDRALVLPQKSLGEPTLVVQDREVIPRIPRDRPTSRDVDPGLSSASASSQDAENPLTALVSTTNRTRSRVVVDNRECSNAIYDDI